MLEKKGKGRKEERTKICLTKGKDGICFSLSFPKCHSNGRKDPHVTTTIKRESIQSADKFFEEFLDIRKFMLARDHCRNITKADYCRDGENSRL